MGVQAEAQLEHLCQAHVLLGCPVGGGGMGGEEVNRAQQVPDTQTPCLGAITPFNTRSRAGAGGGGQERDLAVYCDRRQLGGGGQKRAGRTGLKARPDLYF